MFLQSAAIIDSNSISKQTIKVKDVAMPIGVFFICLMITVIDSLFAGAPIIKHRPQGGGSPATSGAYVLEPVEWEGSSLPFRKPHSMVRSPGKSNAILVADTGNGIVSEVSIGSGGKLTRQNAIAFTCQGFRAEPRGMAVDDKNQLYVAIPRTHRVVRLVRDTQGRFSVDSTFKTEWDAKNQDFKNGKCSTKEGGAGDTFEPTDISISSKGEIAVSSGYNARVYILDYHGNCLLTRPAFARGGMKVGAFSKPRYSTALSYLTHPNPLPHPYFRVLDS